MEAGDDDEDDEEENEDPEPMLNFIRIRNDLLGILEKDSVSCVAVHSKVNSLDWKYYFTIDSIQLFYLFYIVFMCGKSQRRVVYYGSFGK